MQLTRFDRWLRQKYVYETHFYTMREIETPPKSVLGYKLPDKQGQRFHYKYVVRSEKIAGELAITLKANNMMFTTRIVDREAWYVSLIAPKGKSVTWSLISWLGIISLVSYAAYGVLYLLSNPEMRKYILESIEILKG